jgi:predicted glutamine amidotransferase
LKPKNLRGEKAVLVCSEPLTIEEKWEEISNHQLLLIDKNLKIQKFKI